VARTIRATEASRRFSSVLDRVRFDDESFDIVRNGEVVARIVPPERKGASPRDFERVLAELEPLDDDFAAELEEIRAQQPPMNPDPWTS
jgi:prevent-host-death family protein